MPDELRMHVWLNQTGASQDDMTLDVTIFVPPGRSAKLEDRFAAVRSHGGPERRLDIAPLYNVVRSAPAREAVMALDSEMLGTAGPMSSGEYYMRASVYKYHLRLPIDRPDRFVVVLPGMPIDGRSAPPSEVAFSRKSSVRVVAYCE